MGRTRRHVGVLRPLSRVLLDTTAFVEILRSVDAAEAGKSLSDYLLAEIRRIAALPTRDEMLARIHSRSRVEWKVLAADVIRRERESA